MIDRPSDEQIAEFIGAEKAKTHKVDGVHACEFCDLPMTGEPSRKKYHTACLPAVKEAAKDARRKCKKCKKVKAASSYSNDSSRPDGKFPWCKMCQGINNGLDSFQNPEDELNGRVCPMDDVPIRGNKNRKYCSATCRNRTAQLKLKYNLTPEQYRTMVDQNNGRCPICLKRCYNWQVDHNHKTMEVTGVICAPCNVGGVAWTFHDIEFVRRLLDYLENTPASKLGITAEANPVYAQNGEGNLHAMWSRNANSRAGKSRYGQE